MVLATRALPLSMTTKLHVWWCCHCWRVSSSRSSVDATNRTATNALAPLDELSELTSLAVSNLHASETRLLGSAVADRVSDPPRPVGACSVGTARGVPVVARVAGYRPGFLFVQALMASTSVAITASSWQTHEQLRRWH